MVDGPAARAASRMDPAEDAFVAAYWGRYSIEDIAGMLNRGPETVRQRGRQLGLPPLRRGGRREAAAPLRSRRDRPEGGVPTAAVWPDGWSISPPTEAQLMAGR